MRIWTRSRKIFELRLLVLVEGFDVLVRVCDVLTAQQAFGEPSCLFRNSGEVYSTNPVNFPLVENRIKVPTF
jgi:hypothetical protein